MPKFPILNAAHYAMLGDGYPAQPHDIPLQRAVCWPGIGLEKQVACAQVCGGPLIINRATIFEGNMEEIVDVTKRVPHRQWIELANNCAADIDRAKELSPGIPCAVYGAPYSYIGPLNGWTLEGAPSKELKDAITDLNSRLDFGTVCCYRTAGQPLRDWEKAIDPEYQRTREFRHAEWYAFINFNDINTAPWGYFPPEEFRAMLKHLKKRFAGAVLFCAHDADPWRRHPFDARIRAMLEVCAEEMG